MASLSFTATPLRLTCLPSLPASIGFYHLPSTSLPPSRTKILESHRLVFKPLHGREGSIFFHLRAGSHREGSKTSFKLSSRLGAMHDLLDGATSETSSGSDGEVGNVTRTPILLFDVMDTLVRDPFYDDMPKFFRMTMKELLASKHPTAWIEFEKGLISENELFEKFFSDGRDFDSEGLKECMASGYEWLAGCEHLVSRLHKQGYTLHAFTNYPTWYRMIEDKLRLSRYLHWTFVSCHTGMRKPELQAFTTAAKYLNCQPSDCVFIDDRPSNVEAAKAAGMEGIVFTDAAALEKKLSALGITL